MKQFLPLLALAACTHNRPLHPQELVGDEVEVEVSTAPGVEVTVRVEKDPVVPGKVVLRSAYGDIQLDQVTRMEQNSSGMGLLEGLAIGAAIGVTGGALIGLASGDDTCDNSNDRTDCAWTFSAGEKAVLLGIFFGGMSGFVGLVIGAVSGATYVYDVKQPRIIPVGPPGSAAGVTLHF